MKVGLIETLNGTLLIDDSTDSSVFSSLAYTLTFAKAYHLLCFRNFTSVRDSLTFIFEHIAWKEI